MHSTRFLLLAICLLAGAGAQETPTSAADGGAKVTYALPTEGPLPRTWRVTLAIVDPKNPDWIISQFASGVVRTVTTENGGRFSETWNGLDDNFMPVPPGTYAVKGICMPAARWEVDGEYHSVTPRYVTEANAWQRPTEPFNVAEFFGGDPVSSPLADIAVGPNGTAVFYYQYLENGTNNPMIDLTKPLGPGQFIRAFPSGGAGGGTSTTTDGETVWSFSTDGGRPYLYRADQRPFGRDSSMRNNVHHPAGWVTAMACTRDAAAGRSIVYVAQRGAISEAKKNHFGESATEPVDVVSVHDGGTGEVLATLPLSRPIGLAARGDKLLALHADAKGNWLVSQATIAAGIPKAPWMRLFALPPGTVPAGFAVDSHRRCYVSVPAANKVLQFDPAGKALRSFGKLPAQKPGGYDRETLMSPGKLAAWTAEDGDRLLIIEQAGPNRVSEWSADGKLVREFLSLQTKANSGYTVDPANPSHLYISGHQQWLTRFVVDPAKRAWSVDAVWPLVTVPGISLELDHPRFLRVGGREYLAGARSHDVYRRDGDRWLLSAAIIRTRTKDGVAASAWHDADGDGAIDAEECRPLAIPNGALRYHGERWLDDLSLLSVAQGTQQVLRLPSDRFDAHGNPVFGEWTEVLKDPVFVARRAGTADAVHGGNELSEVFDSDWSNADGSMAEGFYVQARGGPSFSANYGAQYKVTRYDPDGKGGFALRWRTGRTALGPLAEPGEIVSAMHIRKPINRLVSIIDQSRAGVVLYTDEGLYVDTLFPDGRKFTPAQVGIYALPGEFFAGDVFSDRRDGRVYLAFGKQTPQLFTVDGWTLTENPVRPLPEVQRTVTIAASQVAAPPEIALSVRGGSGTARFASVGPAIGGAVLDGSLAGWESCAPVRFKADDQRTVEVRLLYDPETLYLRWHARLGADFAAKPLAPIERIFTHDRLADTLSFYLQGDPKAAPDGGTPRPGDVRVVFGLFSEGGKVTPVALGMYPTWSGPGTAQRYSTAAGGLAAFGNVAAVAGARLGHRLDDDGKGFVLVAALPRAALPRLPPLVGGLTTLVNFEATFAGHTKFWWANSDGSASRETYDEPTEARLYPGSWAPVRFLGLEQGITIRNWLICGPFGGAGAEAFSADPPGPAKDRARKLFDAAVYPPDQAVDPTQVFRGDLVRGWWPDPGEVRWHPAAIADLDTRVVLGLGAQVWYGATWIHAPRPTEVSFRFQGHPMTTLAFSLNGQPLRSGEIRDGDRNPPQEAKGVTLRQGWNEVTFRGYCVGYPPFRAGLVIDGDADTLWTLRLAGTPPGKP
jgi:hypothetical protein